METEARMGAAMLDEVSPGWFERIDLETLDVQRGDRCLLGQALRLYCFPEARKSIGLSSREAFELGFNCHFYPEDLNDTWRTIIRERLASAVELELIGAT